MVLYFGKDRQNSFLCGSIMFSIFRPIQFQYFQNHNKDPINPISNFFAHSLSRGLFALTTYLFKEILNYRLLLVGPKLNSGQIYSNINRINVHVVQHWILKNFTPDTTQSYYSKNSIKRLLMGSFLR